ncbi:MAG: SDR family oxidoreductase [Anaerolineae bacterium]|jgi:NAD(P)-dependent dehydrogenase (short-subunit alcohol dehydrogenase family)|nr:SDR family oxidoreductase [Anaerolineae bacterium]MBT7071922.1 SDR family oxidoreductase [Anaerolineae bacterium]MBT7323936.1 SDR family oxidoreductase [Anaerolineae bacterium]
MSKLEKKVVVITGSTRGFGYSIAEEMLKKGAIVVISGRSQNSVDTALNALQADDARVAGIPCEVSDEGQVRALAEKSVEKFGQIDIWINNAGFSTAGGDVLDFLPEDAVATFMTNDLGAFHGAQAALGHMLPRGDGVLVNVYGAGSFLKPASPMGLYGMTKAWLTSFTRTLAKEIKGQGVQVIGFSPGMMLTEMLTQPTFIGSEEAGTGKNFGFVLRMLAKPPQAPAAKLVRLLENNKKHFVEYRMMKKWTPIFGLLKILWENITKTGAAPEVEIQYRDKYKWQK